MMNLKNIKSVIGAGLIVLTSITGSYATDIYVSTIDGSDKNFGLVIKHASGESVRISLIDDRAYALLNVSFNTESMIAKKVNLKELPKGTYHLRIEDDDEIISIPVKILFSEVKIQQDKLEKINKPSVKSDGLAVRVQLDRIQHLPSKLLIFDENGHLVHSSKYEMEAVNQTFDFRLLGKGTYRFEFIYPGYDFSQLVTLNE